MSIEVTKLGGSVGAVVSGIDLSDELTGEQVDEIRRVWLDHLVIFFRDQHLSCDQFLAFARRVGRPVPYPLIPSIDGYPEIIEVLKLETSGSTSEGRGTATPRISTSHRWLRCSWRGRSRLWGEIPSLRTAIWPTRRSLTA